MELYDLEWFTASVFGAQFTNLTPPQYDLVQPIAEHELSSIKCWCPLLYPIALQMKIALLLEGMGLGIIVGAAPTTTAAGGDHEAYVIEDEVFDVRRKYKIVDKPRQAVGSSTTGQLQALLDGCKPPLRMGAFLARGIGGLTGGCCVENSISDKAEWNHGGQ